MVADMRGLITWREARVKKAIPSAVRSTGREKTSLCFVASPLSATIFLQNHEGWHVGRLTTHVLDLALGRPAAGLTIELWALDGEAALICKATTNEDGR